jgi:urease alpha subunit
MEHVVGSISTGKYADFAVLDRDWMRIAPDEVMATRFLATYSSGRQVYAAPLATTALRSLRPRRRGGSCCAANG